MGQPRILLVHDHYQQRGGEDEVFAAEGDLLQSRDHVVERYVVHNDTIPRRSRAGVAKDTIWNGRVYDDVRRIVRRERPYVAHFHNTFPLISPAAYYAANAEGVPVVQTLHNYRLICPNALLFRDGHVCEECPGKAVAWPGVVHACYRQSRSATAATVAMLAVHRVAGTWERAVAIYIALTEFARRKFVAAGLPAARIAVKPNFLSADPGPGDHTGAFALFAGRLAPEKGLPTLLEAWRILGGRFPLKVVGTGPLASLMVRRPHNVEWLGAQPRGEVLALMQRATFLVFPSEWYEGFPMALVEAFATGLPVVASAHGSIADIVDDGATGRHFQPGDACDLAAKVDWALSHPKERAAIGRRARLEFESKYTAARNYSSLMHIYGLACGRCG